MEAPTTPVPRLIPLAEARLSLSPQEFRIKLRQVMLANPRVTLKQIAVALHVSRQRVSLIVGRLNRPNCASNPGPRPAPKTEQAKQRMAELTQRVANGESAESAAAELQISLNQARALGFKVHKVRPAHGTQARAVGAALGVGDDGPGPCDCWRCRKAAGIALPRGPKSGPVRRAQVEDWLAYRDPDTDQPLRQIDIARLSGVAQGMVSRISRGEV